MKTSCKPNSQTQLKAVLSRKNLYDNKEYLSYTKDILSHTDMMKLKNCKHHLVTSRFQHCINVSYYNYAICKFLKMDARSAARAGLLHDLYFYEKHNGLRRTAHLKKHPKIAISNALKIFDLTAKEYDMITKHMWPITASLPNYKETFVIIFIDKFCAIAELVKGSINIIKTRLCVNTC